MTDPLLAVRDLTISSASQTLVHPLNFAIAPGERVGLIGESGSGKSLTSSAVMGLLPSELTAQGEVALAGESGNLLTQSEKSFARLRGSRMSMVFQEPMSALNPLMRVGDQVAEVMRLHRTASGDAASKRAIELLDQVHLPDPSAAAKAYPHQLSGGQRQRIMLAIALANSPDLLICDEPTTALDVTVQSAVLDLIDEQVTARGTGLLFITHDLAVVARVCERVMVMNAGRVVETGTVDEIFTAPQHEYTRGLLAASDLTATDSRGRLFTIATADQYAGADQQATAAEVPVTSEQTHESAPAAAPGADHGLGRGRPHRDDRGRQDLHPPGRALPQPQGRGARGHRPLRARGRTDGHRRGVGVRQVDAPVDPLRPRSAHRRCGPRGGRRRRPR